MLVRIQPAARSGDMLDILNSEDYPEDQWEELGILVPAPAYGLGKYDSTRCEPSSTARKLYNFRSDEEEILIQDVLEEVRVVNWVGEEVEPAISSREPSHTIVYRLPQRKTRILRTSITKPISRNGFS